MPIQGDVRFKGRQARNPREILFGSPPCPRLLVCCISFDCSVCTFVRGAINAVAVSSQSTPACFTCRSFMGSFSGARCSHRVYPTRPPTTPFPPCFLCSVTPAAPSAIAPRNVANAATRDRWDDPTCCFEGAVCPELSEIYLQRRADDK